MADTLRLQSPEIMVLLVRKIRLESWEHRQMPAHFWRLYFNASAGAWVRRDHTTYQLHPQTWTLLSPGTPIETNLKRPCDHFFIHFTLGPNLQPHKQFILQQRLDQNERDLFSRLEAQIDSNADQSAKNGLLVQHLICRCLLQLSPETWRPSVNDQRIVHVLEKIHLTPESPPSVAELAAQVDLHPKSLGRLFHHHMGVGVHAYGLRYRLNCSLRELYHSTRSIEEIALKNGFSDRYHFTKAIAKHCGTTPGRLRLGHR
jgi:AraC-like DNA-binding protein